jgi:hypothetical protein
MGSAWLPEGEANEALPRRHFWRRRPGIGRRALGFAPQLLERRTEVEVADVPAEERFEVSGRLCSNAAGEDSG